MALYVDALSGCSCIDAAICRLAFPVGNTAGMRASVQPILGAECRQFMQFGVCDFCYALCQAHYLFSMIDTPSLPYTSSLLEPTHYHK